jgi:hypothetical protein
VQDRFFDADSGWVIDRHSPIPRYFFYDMPKKALFCWVGILVV